LVVKWELRIVNSCDNCDTAKINEQVRVNAAMVMKAWHILNMLAI